jgi:hypothetical protein
MCCWAIDATHVFCGREASATWRSMRAADT